MSTLDLQALGWVDDETESGHLRVSLTKSNLVMQPFRRGHVFLTNSGGGSSFWQEDGVEASDTRTTGNAISLHSGATLNGYGAIQTGFWGRKLGVLSRGIAASQPYQVAIDAVVYDVTQPQGSFQGAAVLGAALTMRHLISDKLTDGYHDLDIRMVADGVNSDVTNLFYGLLVERRWGYTDPLPVPEGLTPQLLTSTADTVLNYNQSDGSGGALMYWTGWEFYNSSGSQVTLTAKKSGTVRWTYVLAAGQVWQWIPPGNRMSVSASYTVAASAANVVTVTTYGGWE